MPVKRREPRTNSTRSKPLPPKTMPIAPTIARSMMMKAAPTPEKIAPRIYYLHHRLIGQLDDFAPHLDRAQALGFDTALVSPVFETEDGHDVFTTLSHRAPDRSFAPGMTLEAALERLSAACQSRGMDLFLDLALDRLSANHVLAQDHPAAFTIRREIDGRGSIDPRQPQPLTGEAFARLLDPSAAEVMETFGAALVGTCVKAGVAGFRVVNLGAAPPPFWRGLIGRVQALGSRPFMLAEIEGMPRAAAKGLKACGFDAFTSSLAWWDGREAWLVEEYEDLRSAAPLIAVVETPFGRRTAEAAVGPDDLQASRRALELAAATGSGLLVPMGFEFGVEARLDPYGADLGGGRAFHGPAVLTHEVIQANRRAAELAGFSGDLRRLSGAASPVTALLRVSSFDVRTADEALLALINPSQTETIKLDQGRLLAGCDFGPFTTLDAGSDPFTSLAPGAVSLSRGKRTPPLIMSPSKQRYAESAAQAPRLVVEGVSPCVDGGPFPVKWTINEPVLVEADVFADGHEALAVELQWRAAGAEDWSAAPMSFVVNDRWRGSFRPEQLGRYEFRVQAWIDRFGGVRADYVKKLDAGVATDLDLQEGWLLVAAAASRAPKALSDALGTLVLAANAGSAEDRRRLLLEPETLELMARADDRPFLQASAPPQQLDAERISARFASWYELFPRSQTDSPQRHGRFDDVIARLPAVRDMGFDVLYFPPIHPIGRKNRKGPNNSLTAGPGDPGSPYAIGSDKGGHDAIHPELGTLDDFRRLVSAAADVGLEIALDFAIQCSPDHPWLKDHPDWFAWRSDGSIRYAENPPKKYEDIVNVDFYASGAVPALWSTLRDIVLHWVSEGVKTFRVDNPHTKPLPFWEWLIGDVRREHPEVIFLAEAFTTPKMMYRLAKIGFSQSYTYFTWRNSKAEFTDYLTELAQGPPKHFFRPHFFVNTPDINPYFLQGSGRAGFLIRAALAATLSGLWGVYSGFELLEAEPLAGKEEYLDSEKFQIKPRDWSAPGNIITEIAELNRLRKAHPALQTHLGIEFFGSSNPNVLYFGKAVPDQEEMILVAISLDPHYGQDCQIEAPFWRLGLQENDPIAVVNLLADDRFTWWGRNQRIWLDPGHPYVIFQIKPERR